MSLSVERAREPRRPGTLAVLGLAALACVALLAGLGVWQLERLSWKLNLIREVDARVSAAATAFPPPSAWPAIAGDTDEYRHVTAPGHFLNGKELLSEAVTDKGAGFWVMTPFVTDQGFTVLVNRGFVPADRRDAASRPAGETRVTGLLRISEPGGGFLRGNDPAHGRWYSRDVAAMAAAQGLAGVAPYFVDADATPNAGGLPVGGLTVIRFDNNHLVYALTWFGLALMLIAASGYVGYDEYRLRRRLRQADPAPAAGRQPAG